MDEMDADGWVLVVLLGILAFGGMFVAYFAWYSVVAASWLPTTAHERKLLMDAGGLLALLSTLLTVAIGVIAVCITCFKMKQLDINKEKEKRRDDYAAQLEARQHKEELEQRSSSRDEWQRTTVR